MADESTKNDDNSRQGNKAQAEFQKYLQRMQAQGGIPGFIMPAQASAPGWAVPPSLAMLPGAGPFSPAASGHNAEGSLTARLGSTLRLGVDVLNAVLEGGVRFLNGVSGAAYGDQQYGAGCGPSCGCNSCCSCDSCCGSSCCGGCDCCQPSVGSCC